jgi:hypothetical protein
MSSSGCAAHGNASAEVRALAESLAEALEPWAQRLRRAAEERDAQPGGELPATCTWCPVCAVVGLLRGERPELAARLAEHGVGLLAALRELLSESATATPGGAGAGGADSGKRDVQRVPLRRAGARPQSGAGGGAGGGAEC